MGTTFDRLMNEQGRKATWLAEQIGYSSALISRIRSGERAATPDFRRKAAAALGVPEDELFPEVAATAA